MSDGATLPGILTGAHRRRDPGLLRWLRLGADGQIWSDYDVVIDDETLRIVVRMEEATPDARSSCVLSMRVYSGGIKTVLLSAA